MYYCRECSNSPLVEYDATRLQCPKCKKLYSNPNPQPKLEEVEDFELSLSENVQNIDNVKSEKIVLEEIDEDEYLRVSLIQEFWSHNERNFCDEDKNLIDDCLMKISLKRLTYLSTYKFKSTKTALILSIFLGIWGADRFYINDVGFGLCKLLLDWIGCILWIIDIFLIVKATRKTNFYDFRDVVIKELNNDIIGVMK